MVIGAEEGSDGSSEIFLRSKAGSMGSQLYILAS